VTLPEGFELGEHRSTLEEAAKQAGWTIERDGAVIAVRDVWTENEDHAAWLVATQVGWPAAGAGYRLGWARRVARGRSGVRRCREAASRRRHRGAASLGGILSADCAGQ
jgi:hypothetical protein